MGVVYTAQDPRLDRQVAIKVLPPDLTRDETAKQRFLQEAQVASALDHPNICTIFEINGTDDRQLYLVMAYYEGETLKERIERGYKSDIWEGGHRVPFLARWPARIAPGSSSDETVCLTDLLATCAAILGDELPGDAGEDSYDILPALVGEPYDGPIREATVHHAGDGSFSIRQGRWKLELTPSSGGYGNLDDEELRRRNLPAIQLYDLEADIAETRNVCDRYPEVVERLTALLESCQERDRSTSG